MSEITKRHVEGMEKILEFHDRYICEYDTLENPASYYRLVLKDTHEGDNTISPAFLSDLEKSNWYLEEIRNQYECTELILSPTPVTGYDLDTAL